ncbi:MAG: PAS domain S-box protein [bacterium]|nr:PAS domain S-box protein [Candidatus Kapabacteria bacterium]
MFVVDELGTIITWNPGVHTVLGYDEREFVGRNVRMLVGADDIAEGVIDRERIAARGGGNISLRRWHKRKDGTLVWGDGHLVALHDGESFVGYAFVVRDDSDSKLIEGERDLASRQKDRFLATVSHELRMPLMAVLGWIRVLQQGGLSDDEAQNAFATIERNALMQRRLIDELLDCAKVVSGTLSVERAPVDLRAIVVDEIESMRIIVAEKDIRLDVDIAVNSLVVSADGDRMHQVVGNLLSNAIKFTLDGGTISVKLKRKDSIAEITISDTGVGINPEFLPFLFERFRQAATSGPLSEFGVGLGLCIVRELVELHEGTITVSSAGIGKGATFIVRMPI